MAVERDYGLPEANMLDSLIRNKRELYRRVERTDPMGKQLFYLKREIDILERCMKRLLMTANTYSNMIAEDVAAQMVKIYNMPIGDRYVGFIYYYQFQNMHEIVEKYWENWTAAPVAFASNVDMNTLFLDMKFIDHDKLEPHARIIDVLPMEIKKLERDHD